MLRTAARTASALAPRLMDQDGQAGWVDPGRQIVERHLDYMCVHRADGMHVVAARLGVGQHDELAMTVLAREAGAQAAGCVVQMARAGGTVAERSCPHRVESKWSGPPHPNPPR